LRLLICEALVGLAIRDSLHGAKVISTECSPLNGDGRRNAQSMSVQLRETIQPHQDRSQAMRLLLIAQLLTLLAVANGTPIFVEKVLGGFLAYPVDGGLAFADGKPPFGSSKTLRGVVLSILVTTAFAPVIGLSWKLGAMVALMAMLGDLFSSFVKRRMGLAPSDRATGLDQLPESVLPLLACAFFLPLTLLDFIVATVLFFFGELVLSRLLFKLNLRNRPY
jgi:hypothetical protein